MGYREMPIQIRAVDVMAEGGGAVIDTKFSSVSYPVFAVCTLAVQG